MNRFFSYPEPESTPKPLNPASRGVLQRHFSQKQNLGLGFKVQDFRFRVPRKPLNPTLLNPQWKVQFKTLWQLVQGLWHSIWAERPLNNPYSSPLHNPPIYPPLRSLDYGSCRNQGWCPGITEVLTRMYLQEALLLTCSRGVAAPEDSIIPMHILQPQLHACLHMCV